MKILTPTDQKHKHQCCCSTRSFSQSGPDPSSFSSCSLSKVSLLPGVGLCQVLGHQEQPCGDRRQRCEGWTPSLCTAPAPGGESRLDMLLQDCAARA